MTDYDVPWKEVLDAYLSDFLELCLPEIHDGIDWKSPVENHEQELPQLFPNSQASGRVADKLFRARFKASKQPTWFMIHTEVQVTRQAEQVRRLFRFIDWVMDLPSPLELQFRNALLEIESEKHMPYVTSIERLAKNEGKIEGKIQLLQDLLGLPVMSDAILEAMSAEQLDSLYTDLRQRLDSK